MKSDSALETEKIEITRAQISVAIHFHSWVVLLCAFPSIFRVTDLKLIALETFLIKKVVI